MAGIKHRVEPSASALAALQSGAGTTWYLNGEDSQGLSYEREEKTNGIIEHKHYLSAGGMVFAMQVTRSGTLAAGNAAIGGNLAASLRYFHHDQLGSVAAVSDGITGAVIERLAYDPWGKRRSVNGLSDVTDSLTGLTTDRGFTMHEHLDEMGVVHMNGRIYDPLIGRFMSADPFIQAPGMLQSHNRYAYVMNNPLNLTDPSGYWSFRQFFRGVVNIFAPVIAALPAKIASPIINILSLACGPGAPVCAGVGQAALAYYHGASTADALRTGVRAGVTAFLFQQAGNVPGADSFERYAAHAGAGCVSAAISGGNCGTGAASALFGKFTSNQIAGIGDAGIGGDIVRGIATAVAGGVGSVIAGGKFANGAETAAYGYLFNHAFHKSFEGDSGFHAVNTYSATCFTASSNCTAAGEYAALLQAPAPGVLLDRAVQNGELASVSIFAPGTDLQMTRHLGDVRVWRYDSEMRILNVTEPNHLLHIGYASRQIEVGLFTTGIRTIGYGMGPQSTMNQAAAFPLWFIHSNIGAERRRR